MAFGFSRRTRRSGGTGPSSGHGNNQLAPRSSGGPRSPPRCHCPEACCSLPFSYIICDSFMLPGAPRLTALTLSICHQHPLPPSISLLKGTLNVFMFYSLKNSFHLDMICMFLWDKPSFRREKQQREEKQNHWNLISVDISAAVQYLRARACVCTCVCVCTPVSLGDGNSCES